MENVVQEHGLALQQIFPSNLLSLLKIQTIIESHS